MALKEEIIITSKRGKFYIRPYRPGDEKAILASWRLAFGKEMSLEEWRWKYIENPAGYRILICVAEEGTVVCHYAAQVRNIALGKSNILGLHLTDSFSHPRFRWAIGGKTGLFVKTGWIFLNTFLEEIGMPGPSLSTPFPKAQFHYGFPGQRHFLLGLKLMKYRPHGPGILFLKSKQPKNFRLLSKNDLFFSLREEKLEDFSFWEEIESIFYLSRNKETFAVKRNQEFLKWRFSCPGKEYKIFYLKNFLNKKIKAWIIFDAKNQKNKEIKILDFWALNARYLAVLLRKVLKETKATFVVWMAGNHPFKQAFLEVGFQPEQEPLGIIPNTRCDFKMQYSPEDANKFFFTIADSDLF